MPTYIYKPIPASLKIGLMPSANTTHIVVHFSRPTISPHLTLNRACIRIWRMMRILTLCR